MSEALPDVNLAHKAEVERKLNIGKEKKAAADECFKGGDIKGGKCKWHSRQVKVYLHVQIYTSSS